MRKKRHKGKRHLSGKELLEKRREERELAEKRMREKKEDDRQFIRECALYPASLFMDTKITGGGQGKMMDVECCLICGEAIPEGTQVCKSCIERYRIETGQAVEIAEEMRDIAGALSIAENTDGNIKKSVESILRISDRLEREALQRKRIDLPPTDGEAAAAGQGKHNQKACVGYEPAEKVGGSRPA